MAASMGLAIKLLDKGYNIHGYLEHLWFVAELASLGRFRPDSIVAYDQGVRDKATAKGMEVFGYGDVDNFFRFLGSAALQVKKEGKTKTVPVSRYADAKAKTSEIKELKICGMFNYSSCPCGQTCYRKHVCFACLQGHPRSECPNVTTDNSNK